MPNWFKRVDSKLDLILKGVTKMDANEQKILDSLTNLETALTDDFNAVSADLKALASANPGGISAADALTIASRIDAATAGVKTQTAAAKAALTPPASPPPGA